MESKRAIQIGTYLSLVLRHDPRAGEITLDAQGWASVDELLAGAGVRGVAVTRDDLGEVVRSHGKGRFALSPDGSRIRASQGQGLSVELGLAPVAPPELLFHGTEEDALLSVVEVGLERNTLHYVHLSGEVEAAAQVGALRERPVILGVAAQAMHTEGFQFYRSEDGGWLTEAVPPRFIHRAERADG